jgi:hypothetical protein
MAVPLKSIRVSEHDRKLDVDHLLSLSARHVSVVEFGRNLDRRLDADQSGTCTMLDTDSATLETGLLTLVLASAVTALDLCAAALWLWVNPKARRYADVENVQAAAEDANLVIPDPLLSWLHRTKGSHPYRPVKQFRDAQIHRTVRQDAHVTVVDAIGPGETSVQVSRSVSADPSKLPTHERGELLDQVATFVLERWQTFWRLFENLERLSPSP